MPRPASQPPPPQSAPPLSALPTTEGGRLVRLALLINALFFAAAAAVYASSRSQLVLAQGADSLLDVVAGIILSVSASVGVRPRDANHPFGHHRAEPIGALVTAVLAGVLAFEILRSGIWGLATGARADLDAWVAGLLGGKLAAKLALLVLIRRTEHGSMAVEAARVDTRNDVVACLSSVVGYAMARGGWAWADAALALPVAVYIGANGFSLARENLRYLMGEAPPATVLRALEQIARSVRGVEGVPRLRAHHVGPLIHVEVAVRIDERSTATEGHDIAVEVQRRLEARRDVGEVFVHVDTRDGVEHGGH